MSTDQFSSRRSDSAFARCVTAAEAIAPSDSGPALAAALEMLQHLTVDDSERARAEHYFSRVLVNAVRTDGAVLDRLLAEERTSVLSEPLRRSLAFLHALAAGRFDAARKLLGQLVAVGSTPVERILGCLLLMHDQRLIDAIAAAADFEDHLDLGPLMLKGDIGQFVQRRMMDLAERPVARDRVFLTLCSAMRNEARYLEEWIVHHALVGVDRFCLYDNESRDETVAILERLQRHFAIEIRPWHTQPANLLAYVDCVRREVGRTEWLACIDSDEFLMPAVGHDLRALLAEAGDAAAVVPNWRIFGSSGLDRRPTGLCIRNFTGRAPDEFQPNRHVKSIVRPDRVVRILSPHHFMVVGRQVDGMGNEVLPLAGRLATPRLGRIAVNHYIVRSREDFEHKMARSRLVDGRSAIGQSFDGYFEANDQNQVEDRSAWRYVPAIEARIASLAIDRP